MSNERIVIDYTLPEYSLKGLFDDETDTLSDKLKDIVYYPIYRFFRWHFNPKNIYRQAKWFIQRGRRGYADCDVWNLSYYTSRVMRDELRQLADIAHGWPGVDPWLNFEDWVSALRRVADGLDHYIAGIDIKETCTCCGKYCNDSECPIVIEAFNELQAIWSGLWD